jgi:hypothetical protein
METKIPFYNLVNMYLTGLIFTGCCIILFNKEILLFIELGYFKSIKSISIGLETIATISCFSIIYEVGYIINRVGSLLENLLKLSSKIMPFNNDYKKLNERKATYPIVSTLSREYALSRTSMTLFLLVTVITIIHIGLTISIFPFLLTGLFYFSMRKHACKIVKIMED